MKKVLSCIQPTGGGEIHLGNYFGAVKNWVDLQSQYQCLYGVVNNHAMTMPYDAVQLRETTWNIAYQLVACGIKPENVFIQSLVPEHTELAWILGCVTSFGELSKMTQFKDKREQLEATDSKTLVSTGLFFYPVLQAADILVYNADFVPVGKDQEQHLELARNIAERFNYQFKTDYFVAPKPLFTDIKKLLSPADPTKKMSKSLGEKHYINLFGEEAKLRKQIKSAVTDSGEKPTDGTVSAGVQNLLELLKACEKNEIAEKFQADYFAGTIRYGDLKSEVAEALVTLTTPFRERLQEIKSNESAFKAQILDSSAQIRKIAHQTMQDVKEITGIF